jgi:hypothetical protein
VAGGFEVGVESLDLALRLCTIRPAPSGRKPTTLRQLVHLLVSAQAGAIRIAFDDHRLGVVEKNMYYQSLAARNSSSIGNITKMAHPSESLIGNIAGFMGIWVL